MGGKKIISETGATLGKILADRGVSQYGAAAASGSSQPYLNQVVRGLKTPSAEWLNTISLALKLTEAEKVKLHRAAARDHGFKIDLTKP